MTSHTYLVVSSKIWNRSIFDSFITTISGQWHYIDDNNDLEVSKLEALSPRYIFFMHWSEKIPSDVLNRFECVVFHMTDVPFGRGGSPLQNLIVRGHRQTKLTALRMVEDFDAGPIYLQCDLSLEGSSAEEIYLRASHLSAQMIKQIVADNPTPVPQSGEVTVFRRRKPEHSAIPLLDSLQQLHDFIRMLDADGYPHAFIEHEGFRYEFRRAVLYDGRIVADVTVVPIEEKNL